MEEEEEELVVEGEVEVCSNDCLHNHRATKKKHEKKYETVHCLSLAGGGWKILGVGVTKCLGETEGKAPVRDKWHITALDGRIR